MKQRRMFLVLSILLSGFLLQGCLSESDQQSPPPPYTGPLPQILGKADKFKDCAEMTSWREERQLAWNTTNAMYSGWSYAAPTSGGAMPATSPSTHTSVSNVQVAGIDEPDFVKMRGDHIYYARAHSVEVFSARGLAPIATLQLEDLSNLQLLQFANRLAVIGSKLSAVEVRLFKDSGGKLSEESAFSFRGSLLTARLNKSDLTLVMQDSQGVNSPDVACDRVVRPVIDNSYDFSVTAIHTLNLAAEKVVSESTASIGATDQVYMSSENLYLFSTGYSWFAWDPRAASDPLYNSSVVRKFRLRPSKEPQLVGVTAVRGRTRNNLAFNEDPSGRYLFIATTMWETSSNRIWVLGDNPKNPDEAPLAVVATSADFGHREDIRAVRFVGERAYVVTFEKTDPLFVFDLSAPEHPRLLSELEIPGFSAYLHALSPNALFGAGYAATPENGFSWLAGLQLSLFNLEEDGRVTVAAQKQFGGRGSHIDAAHDYHAFTHDPRTGLIALPVRVMAADTGPDPWSYSTRLEFSGAFVIDPRKGLEPVARLTHFEWIPDRCYDLLSNPTWWNTSVDSLDIRRVITIDEGLITLSPFGAKLHEARVPFATQASLAFSDPQSECPPPRNPYWGD